MRTMKVVILCGGRGTRLHEETEFRPKPLVQIGDQPILVHIMEIYARQGFKSFVLCLGYRGEMIRNFFLNFNAMTADFSVDLSNGSVTLLKPGRRDWNVTLVDTGKNTGTGGRIRRAAPYIEDETFMVTYGDGLADVDMKKLIKHHKKCKCTATVTGVRETSRFGVIEADGKDRVSRFREKPVLDGLISGGYFVFEPAVLKHLEGDGPLEGPVLEELAHRNELALYRHDGYFKSMDTYRDFLELNEICERGALPWFGVP